MRDLALFEANKYLNLVPKPPLYSVHRKESEFDFITIFMSQIEAELKEDNNEESPRLVLLSIVEDCLNAKSGGHIMIGGNSEELVKQAAEM